MCVRTRQTLSQQPYNNIRDDTLQEGYHNVLSSFSLIQKSELGSTNISESTGTNKESLFEQSECI